jgi:beta-galactosidase
MQRHFVKLAIVALLLTSIQWVHASPGNRPRLSLSGDWQAAFTENLERPQSPYRQTIRFPKHKGYKLKKQHNALWCERSVTIPASWKNKRVFINIDKTFYGCRVEVNDQVIGELMTYGGKLDVTSAIQFGVPNRIGLYFGRGGAGIKTLDPIAKSIYAAVKLQKDTKGWDKGESFVGIDCLDDQFYLESVSPTVHISDVWYRTYTRGYPRVSPQVSIDCTTPLKAATVEVTIYEEDSDEIALQKHFSQRDLPCGKTVLDLELRADELKQWHIRQPNLYRGQVIVRDSAGNELDRSDLTLFGLREFWVAGNAYYMNNLPVHFAVDWATGDLSEKLAHGHTLFYDNNHPTTGRMLANNEESTCRELDRLGAGFMAYGVIVTDLNLADPEMAMAYRTWVEGHSRRIRNHPSVLFYGLAMNMGGGWQSFRPNIMGRQSNIEWNNIIGTIGMETQKEVDPTRVVYFHGGSRLGEVQASNIYFNHAPFQEVEDWLLDWKEKGDRPLAMLEFMGTVLKPDYLKGGASFITEYDARHRGDAAYQDEPDDYVAYSWEQVSRQTTHWQFNGVELTPQIVPTLIEGHLRSIRAWRYLGAPLHSWVMEPKKTYKPGPAAYDVTLYKTVQKALAPVQIWLGGPKDNWTAKDHQFTGGETIEKSMVALRDLHGSANWKLSWTLKQGPKTVADSSETFVLGAYARLIRPFSWRAPQVRERTTYTLTMDVRDLDTGTPLQNETFSFTVDPRLEEPRERITWDLIDPSGETADWLRSLDIRTRPYNPQGRRPKVLVIGRKALATLKRLPFTAQQIEEGMRVVLLEQNCRDLIKLGLRPEDAGSRQVFIRDGAHPLLQGLSNSQFKNWRGQATLVSPGPERDKTHASRHIFKCGDRGTVSSNVIEIPQSGPFKSLLECEFDLNYSPLLIWPHGKGELVFWQLDTSGRTQHDPTADRLLRRLADYLKRPLKTRQDKIALCLDAQTTTRLNALGFAAKTISRLPGGRNRILALSGDQPALLQSHERDLSRFLKSGGQVVVLGATEAFLKHPLMSAYTLETRTASRAARSVEDTPLLHGVGPQLMHFRSPLALPLLQGPGTLLNGLAASRPVGRGRIILLQSDVALTDTAPLPNGDKKKRKWLKHHVERTRWNLTRLTSRILTNLSLQSSPALTERLFTVVVPKTFTPINEWAYLGPIAPPEDKKIDPLTKDVSRFLAMRDRNGELTNSRGETVRWNFPTDANNGMGMGGKMNLDQIYGVRLRDLVIATTQVWSSVDRVATIHCGADWWLKISVNGAEVFNTAVKDGSWKNGHGFHNKNVKASLKAGWNEVTAVVGSGSDGHVLWFAMDNPGDLVVSQAITTPAANPDIQISLADIQEASLPERTDLFKLYQGPITTENDPYRYYAW